MHEFSVSFRFWDERFPFECDEKSDQIRLKIINRKYTANHNGTSYGWLIQFELD